MSTTANPLDNSPFDQKVPLEAAGPVMTTVDPFAGDFKDVPPATTQQPTDVSESGSEVPVGAPLSKEETAYLREILRRQMDQDAKAQVAQEFLETHPTYKPTPGNFAVIQQILQASNAEFNSENLDRAFKVAKAESLFPDQPQFDSLESAYGYDRSAIRARMELEAEKDQARRLEIRNSQTIRTSLQDTGREPEETTDSEGSAAFAAHINSLPLHQARRVMESAMARARYNGSSPVQQERLRNSLR